MNGDNLTFIQILRDLAVYSEYISAIVSIIFYYKCKNTPLKYFVFLLIYIGLNEYLGFQFKENGIRYNKIIYNIYNVISFSYLFLLYRSYLNNKKRRKIILYFILVYIISFIINGFYQNYLKQSQTVPYLIASVFLIISVVFYFIQILNSEKVLKVNKNLLFWISVGLFLFYIGIIPFRIIVNSFSNSTALNYLFSIKFILVIAMNLCFIIGFIWSNKERQY